MNYLSIGIFVLFISIPFLILIEFGIHDITKIVISQKHVKEYKQKKRLFYVFIVFGILQSILGIISDESFNFSKEINFYLKILGVVLISYAFTITFFKNFALKELYERGYKIPKDYKKFGFATNLLVFVWDLISLLVLYIAFF